MEVVFLIIQAPTTKWSKNAQTIRQLTADELFECVLQFCGADT